MSLADSLKTATVRDVEVELEVKNKKVEVTVRYKSMSTKDIRAQRELFKQRSEAEETVYLSETLASRVTEIVEAGGNVINVDADLLENMSINNLKAIETAINGHDDPKSETQN